MFTLRRTVLIGAAFTVAALAAIVTTLQAQDVKITDPRSVVMIVKLSIASGLGLTTSSASANAMVIAIASAIPRARLVM